MPASLTGCVTCPIRNSSNLSGYSVHNLLDLEIALTVSSDFFLFCELYDVEGEEVELRLHNDVDGELKISRCAVLHVDCNDSSVDSLIDSFLS